MKQLLLSVAFVSMVFIASAQLFYNEAQYVFLSRSQEKGFLYVRWYKHLLDPAYKLKKMFLDSAGTKLVSKAFYHNELQDGPYTGYDQEQVMSSGNYKNGKPDGQRLYYHNGILIQKASFILGRKAGTWEEYTLTGRLRRRTVYDNLLGTIVSDVFF